MDAGVPGLAEGSLGRGGRGLRGSRARAPVVRRQREFTPAEKKDPVYWEKRRKNNEAAKRSREKRRLNDAALEGRLAALLEENARLRAELRALRPGLGLPGTPGGALLWGSPWTAEPRAPRLEPLLPTVLRPCALGAVDAGLSGCRCGLRSPQNSAPQTPKRVDLALPATFFNYHVLDGPGAELRACWGLWSPLHPQLSPSSEPLGLAPRVPYPVPPNGDEDPEGLTQASLPHKLRLKSRGSSRGPRVWEGSQGPL
ncbi:NFIL3 like protein [Erinaceus europaeus]|uniref:NFIL3 like protein n=1 Tax=Erinaceus europaeus TaxID=9365 RepID=A0ABM3WNS8_ERIEU|nr:NFIL3 like protein [Erinaceus europaeus]